MFNQEMGSTPLSGDVTPDQGSTNLSSVAAAPSAAVASPPAVSTAAPAGAAPAQAAPASSPALVARPPAPATDAAATGAAKPAKDTLTATTSSFGNKMLHGILGALGGSEENLYERDPQTGKMIITAVKRGPGSQWKRIIAGGLTGAFAGAAAKPGPGQLGRAAGAGFGAGEEMVEKQDANRRRQADEDFDAQQKVLVRKAQSAHLTQQIAESGWRMTREKIQFTMDTTKDFNAFQQLIATDGSHTDLGVFPTFADFMEKNNGAETGQMNASGILQAIPEVDKAGNVTGVHGYRITPGWGTQRNKEEVQIDLGGPVNGEWVSKYQTIPANGKSNDEILTLQKAVIEKKSAFEKDKFDQVQQTQRAKIAAGAQVESAKLDLEGKKYTADKGAESREKVADTNAASRENVAATKVSRSDVRDHDKAYVQPAEISEKSYQMMQHAYDEFQEAKRNGKSLPSGAQSMLALSTHLSTTFGNVKGSRVTKDMIQHHLGARSISDAAEVAIQRFTNGDGLSDAQWEAFHDLIEHSRKLSWESAVREGKRKKVPIDFLPEDLKGMAGAGDTPNGATDEVFKGGKLIGHAVNGKFVPLGAKQ